MKCLVTGEDSIALGPNKLVYTFLVAQFLMSTGKPKTHPAHTHTNTCQLFVLVLSLVSAADISLSEHSALALPLPSRTQFSFFFFFLVFVIFPFHFWLCFLLFFVIAFFVLFMLLSLHFTAIALAFKHKNLQQFFVLGLTKICFAKYEGQFFQLTTREAQGIIGKGVI